MAYSSIVKPTEYFDTTLITGNGSTQNITGLEFQPDWIWYKRRNATGHNRLIDSVRGSNKLIQTDLTNAEGTDATYVTSFNSDGWSIGSNTDVNASGGTTVAWSWLGANGTASNGDGSITSTVSVNTTAGFSIVSYTGTGSAATVGHGLGAVPKIIITKGRSFSDDWLTYHESIGNGKYIILNKTDAEASSSLPWNSTTPTSSVFSIGSSGTTNNNGGTIIAYCFAEKKGYSKFGSYTGNGSNDGPFIYTGFSPAFVIIKQTNTTGNWAISDHKRLVNSGNQDDGNGNYVPHMLAANLANDESYFGGGSGNKQDYLSNGFKIRQDSGYANTSGGTYVYLAFAKNPFVANDSGTAVPVTAR